MLTSIDGRIRAKRIKISDTYDTKVDKLLRSAYINYKNIDFKKAITNFETAKLIGGDLDFWHNYTLAYCYLTTGSYKKSKSILEDILDDKPELADTYVLLGFNYLKLNKINKAIEFFKKALSLETYSPKTYYFMSLAKKMKDPESDISELIAKAEKEYTDILIKNPNDFESIIEISNLYATFGDLKLARTHLEKAKSVLDISPEVEEIAYQQSQAPYQNPIWSSFYLNLIEGIILNKEGKFIASNQQFLIALQTPPSGSTLDVAEIYYYMNKNFHGLKKFDEAKKALSLARELDPMITKRAD
jgi:tetratricopeptide (TPR) repeat protein